MSSVIQIIDELDEYFSTYVEGGRKLTAEQCDDIRRLLRELREKVSDAH